MSVALDTTSTESEKEEFDADFDLEGPEDLTDEPAGSCPANPTTTDCTHWDTYGCW